jgi:hypothetical protein
MDTGIFDDDRYWIVEAYYAKADPFDVLLTVQVTNAGAEEDTLHVLPTAWYRNTWAWEIDASARNCEPREAQWRRSIRSSGHSSSLPTTLLTGAGPSSSSATTRRTTSGCSASRAGRRIRRTGSTTMS